MALGKGTKLSIALLFTTLAAGCGGGYSSQSSSYGASSYGGLGLPPSASRPLPADIPASEARPAYERRLPDTPRSKATSGGKKCIFKRLSVDFEFGYDIILGPNPSKAKRGSSCRIGLD